MTVPRHKLVGFQRVGLDPGESKTLTFTISASQMALIDEKGKEMIEPGQFLLEIGGCSPGERGRSLGAPEPVRAEFTVVQ